MSKPLVPDELWSAVEPWPPRERPRPKGGRPRVPDRAALAGIIFVLRTGIPWEYLPRELGCGSGVTCWRRPRQRPAKLHADKGYDYPRCRRYLRRGVDSSEKLGRHRWVVERTLAWLAKYRRLTIRYERRDDIHEAFLHLGCSLICLNYLK